MCDYGLRSEIKTENDPDVVIKVDTDLALVDESRLSSQESLEQDRSPASLLPPETSPINSIVVNCLYLIPVTVVELMEQEEDLEENNVSSTSTATCAESVEPDLFPKTSKKLALQNTHPILLTALTYSNTGHQSQYPSNSQSVGQPSRSNTSSPKSRYKPYSMGKKKKKKLRPPSPKADVPQCSAAPIPAIVDNMNRSPGRRPSDVDAIPGPEELKSLLEPGSSGRNVRLPLMVEVINGRGIEGSAGEMCSHLKFERHDPGIESSNDPVCSDDNNKLPESVANATID